MSLLAIDKLAVRYGSDAAVPLVMRTPGGCGRAYGPTHSQAIEAYFVHTPGIKVVAPSTAYDAKGLLKSAVRDDNPVLMFEHKLLYGSKGPRSEQGALSPIGEVPEGEYLVPIGRGIVRREGRDVTVLAWGAHVRIAKEAAQRLEAERFADVEVIDVAWGGIGYPTNGTISPQAWHFASAEGQAVYEEWRDAYVEYDPELAAEHGFFLPKGIILDALGERNWHFTPLVKEGDKVSGGTRLGHVPETQFTQPALRQALNEPPRFGDVMALVGYRLASHPDGRVRPGDAVELLFELFPGHDLDVPAAELAGQPHVLPLATDGQAELLVRHDELHRPVGVVDDHLRDGAFQAATVWYSTPRLTLTDSIKPKPSRRQGIAMEPIFGGGFLILR